MQSIGLQSVLIPLKDTMTRLYDSKYILIRNIDDDGTYDPSCWSLLGSGGFFKLSFRLARDRHLVSIKIFKTIHSYRRQW